MIDPKKMEAAANFLYTKIGPKEEKFLILALDKSKLAYGSGGAVVEVKNGKLAVHCGPGTARDGEMEEDEIFEVYEDFSEAPEEDREDAEEEESFGDSAEDGEFQEGSKMKAMPDYWFHGIFYHLTRGGSGIQLKEGPSFGPPVTVVFWNTGKEDIIIGDKPLKPNHYRILPPDHPLRKKPRQVYEDALACSMEQTSRKIADIQEQLLAMGCPEDGARALAGYFWRREICPSEYADRPHAVWMEALWNEV